MTEATPAYRLDPLDRAFIGPLTRRQVVVLGGAAVLWLLMLLAGVGVLAGLAVVGVAAVVALPPFAGQPIIDWLPVWCGWMFRGRWARRWVRPLHLTTGGPLLAGAGAAAVARRAAHRRPPDDRWAAIHDTAAKTLTAHLQIAGTGFTTLAPRPDGRSCCRAGGRCSAPSRPTTGWCGSPGPTSPAGCRWSATTTGRPGLRHGDDDLAALPPASSPPSSRCATT